jgi:hypothetical protein
MNHKTLAKVQIQVRTVDAIQEQWYTTDRTGSASISLPADPSVVVILYNRIPFVYRFTSACGGFNNTDGDTIACVPARDSTQAAFPQ